MQPTPHNVQGQQEHKHSNGKISIVNVEIACMVVRCIRVANLPPEVQDAVLHATVSNIGDVNDIKEEQWSRLYRYSISNGIRIVELYLKTHVPSHMFIRVSQSAHNLLRSTNNLL